MTNLDLSAIEARVNAATRGPWHLGKPDRNGEDAHMCEIMTEYATKDAGADVPCYDLICRTWSPYYLAASVRIGRKECFANADFIAHARSDIPDLTAEVRRLEGENARMIERIAELERKAGERG